MNEKLMLNHDIGRMIKKISEAQSDIYKVDNQLEKAIENKKFIDEVLEFCLGQPQEEVKEEHQ